MIVRVLFILSLYGAFAQVLAAEKISCDKLAEVATSLASVVSAFEKNPQFHKQKHSEENLIQLITTLNWLAELKNDAILSSNVNKLSKLWAMNTWKDADFIAFKDTLNNVVTNFERIHKKDCK